MVEILALVIDIALGSLAYHIATGVRADLQLLTIRLKTLEATVASLV
jgi:hypothetical protein